jgi:hypothetical protein
LISVPGAAGIGEAISTPNIQAAFQPPTMPNNHPTIGLEPASPALGSSAGSTLPAPKADNPVAMPKGQPVDGRFQNPRPISKLLPPSSPELRRVGLRVDPSPARDASARGEPGGSSTTLVDLTQAELVTTAGSPQDVVPGKAKRDSRLDSPKEAPAREVIFIQAGRTGFGGIAPATPLELAAGYLFASAMAAPSRSRERRRQVRLPSAGEPA